MWRTQRLDAAINCALAKTVAHQRPIGWSLFSLQFTKKLGRLWNNK